MNIFGKIGSFRRYAILVLIWINGSVADSPKMSDTMSQVKAVKDRILNGYDKLIRPTRDGSNTTDVHTGFAPRQIIEVDEEKGLFILDSYFFMSWEDPRLRWNDTKLYTGYLPLPPDVLWLPDISVHNSHSLQVDPVKEVLALVEETGYVYWYPPIHTQTSCPSLLEVRYPDEVVTCIVTMGSWVQDGWEIDFKSYDELIMHEFVNIHPSHSLHADPVQKEVLALVVETGYVIFHPPIHTQTSCPSLLEVRYPDEVVTCVVTMGSWVQDGWEIDFKSYGELIMHEFHNIHPRWELVVSDAKLIRNVTQYEGYEAPYISINAVFPMKRRPPPEIEVTRGPCILVMLLTLSIFWLPTNSSKKVLLGGILFLVLTILIVYVAWSTKFPMGAVFAVSFLQSTMYILAITLLLQILVIFNICNISGPVRPPPIAMQFLTGPFAKYACLRTRFGDDNVPIDRIQLKEDSPNSIESPSPREDWMLFAAGLDRVFFLLMCIAMVAIHHL